MTATLEDPRIFHIHLEIALLHVKNRRIRGQVDGVSLTRLLASKIEFPLQQSHLKEVNLFVDRPSVATGRYKERAIRMMRLFPLPGSRKRYGPLESRV
jgi:hypothetical protein